MKTAIPVILLSVTLIGAFTMAASFQQDERYDAGMTWEEISNAAKEAAHKKAGKLFEVYIENIVTEDIVRDTRTAREKLKNSLVRLDSALKDTLEVAAEVRGVNLEDQK